MRTEQTSQSQDSCNNYLCVNTSRLCELPLKMCWVSPVIRTYWTVRFPGHNEAPQPLVRSSVGTVVPAIRPLRPADPS